jgi:outer membrane protein W
VGGSFSWNIWSYLTGETINIENGAVTGTQIRYINSFPFFLNAHYYFGNKAETFRPYFGVNVGAYYILQRYDRGRSRNCSR